MLDLVRTNVSPLVRFGQRICHTCRPVPLDYNPIVTKSLVCAAVLFLLAPLCFSQTAGQVSPSDTSYVTCGGKPVTSRTVRSDVFASPDGKRRAYVEIEANAVHAQKTPGYSGPLCVNNSRLFVAGDDGQFKLVYLQEPTDAEAGNSLRIVDWSEDGRHLLLELSQWQYESPGVTRSPMIYDARWMVFQQPDMAHVLDKHFGIQCEADVRILGLLPEAKVAIETKPLTPEAEEVLGLQSCSKKKADWTLTIGSESLAPLPEAAKIQHYAKTEPPPK
jgi:hypothetical protein